MLVSGEGLIKIFSYIGFGEEACGFNRGMKWEPKRAMSHKPMKTLKRESPGFSRGEGQIYATRWSQNGLDFEIVFDFKGFVERRGVYTIVLEVEDRQGKIYFATSYSTFVG